MLFFYHFMTNVYNLNNSLPVFEFDVKESYMYVFF